MMPALNSAGSRVVLVGTQKCANDTDAPPVPSVPSTVGDLARVFEDRCGVDPANITELAGYEHSTQPVGTASRHRTSEA